MALIELYAMLDSMSVLMLFTFIVLSHSIDK